MDWMGILLGVGLIYFIFFFIAVASAIKKRNR